MAEAETSLTQRVESLERASRERMVEQGVDLGERVSGLESARDAVYPHLATKADIALIETQIRHTQEQNVQLDKKIDERFIESDKKIDRRSEQFQAKLDAQSEQFQAKLDAQSEQFQAKLDAQSEQLQKIIEQRLNRVIAWMIATGIALAALILSRLPG